MACEHELVALSQQNDHLLMQHLLNLDSSKKEKKHFEKRSDTALDEEICKTNHQAYNLTNLQHQAGYGDYDFALTVTAAVQDTQGQSHT